MNQKQQRDYHLRGNMYAPAKAFDVPGHWNKALLSGKFLVVMALAGIFHQKRL